MTIAKNPRLLSPVLALLLYAFPAVARADENLLGYVKGAETLPQGSSELYQFVTARSGKGTGEYTGVDFLTEVEHGVTDRLTVSGELEMQSVHSQGILIDAYIPEDITTGLQ